MIRKTYNLNCLNIENNKGPYEGSVKEKMSDSFLAFIKHFFSIVRHSNALALVHDR